MVRVLAIRQVFALMDLALVLLIAVTVVVVGWQIVHPALPAVADTAKELLAARADGKPETPTVGPRSQFDALIGSGLFGEAGRWTPDQKPPEPDKADAGPVTETTLNLALHGTISLSPTDPFAAAFIEDKDQRTTHGYSLGQNVVEKVKLVEVFPREVLLLNERNTPATKERLSMTETEGEQEKTASNAAANVPVRATGPDKIQLNRNEFIQDLAVNYADLVTKLKPEMARDDAGKVIGVTASNISQVPIASKLGLSDGDVLQTVNNEPIDSEQKIMEMVQKYRNANTFRIGVLRGGKPTVLTYSLE
jgi:type II secretory pathway component PulC